LPRPTLFPTRRSSDLRTKFAADPVSYLEKDSKPKAPVPEGTIYTCPMHPEIRQVGPGSCPICGMALEPEVASLDAPPNPELEARDRKSTRLNSSHVAI